MIISHKYKFIFIKTVKTAGTSLEIALSEYCDSNDVITPISDEDQAMRSELGFQGPCNYRYNGWELVSALDRDKLIQLTRGKLPRKFANHISARQVRNRVESRLWKDYKKFTVVRNPYDRAISLYWWHLKRTQLSPANCSFIDFLRSQASSVFGNWLKYTENNTPLVDRCVKYEVLEDDLGELSAELGLDKNLFVSMKNIKAKGGIRDDSNGRFSLLDEESRNLISHLCRPEIEQFGYLEPT